MLFLRGLNLCPIRAHSSPRLRAVLFLRGLNLKTYLIRNQRTQKEIADELGVESSAIKRSIERGVFKTGPFADWWKKNIIHFDNINTQSTKEITA